MKRILSIFVICVLMAGLAACGSTGNVDSSASEEPQMTVEPEAQQTDSAADSGEPEPEDTSANALVVYFSATGNTASVAEDLAGMQGAELYEIVPEQPYTEEDLNYSDSSSRSTVEQNDENARPAISGGIDNMDDYDVVYVGFPIWWGDMPRILYTFFDTYDLSGKTIAPFCTSGGSGISGAVQSIRELEPDADVTDGVRVNRSNAEDDLTGWLSDIGL